MIVRAGGRLATPPFAWAGVEGKAGTGSLIYICAWYLVALGEPWWYYSWGTSLWVGLVPD